MLRNYSFKGLPQTVQKLDFGVIGLEQLEQNPALRFNLKPLGLFNELMRLRMIWSRLLCRHHPQRI